MVVKCLKKNAKGIGNHSVHIKPLVKIFTEESHKKYVMIPASKATGNFVTICKKILYNCYNERVRNG